MVFPIYTCICVYPSLWIHAPKHEPILKDFRDALHVPLCRKNYLRKKLSRACFKETLIKAYLRKTGFGNLKRNPFVCCEALFTENSYRQTSMNAMFLSNI